MSSSLSIITSKVAATATRGGQRAVAEEKDPSARLTYALAAQLGVLLSSADADLEEEEEEEDVCGECC